MDNFYFKFEANLRQTFKRLKDEKRMCDVTLATDDGHQVPAHKTILSAGSQYFDDVFRENDYSDIIVYLKGINKIDLEPITDFIYSGEANVKHENVKNFFTTALELRVRGIDGITEGNANEGMDKIDHCKPSMKCNDIVKENSNNNPLSKISETWEEVSNTFSFEDSDSSMPNIIKKEKVDKNIKVPFSLDINFELDSQLSEMMTFYEGLWKCKICGKTSTKKQQIARHVEVHIEGLSHSCNLCGNQFSTRQYLAQHMSTIHSELMCCEICGEAGLTRSKYVNHKRNKHLHYRSKKTKLVRQLLTKNAVYLKIR